ncbi:MAG: cupin domain-containing protein [Solirubrobacterales bacterium]|nr:cupin domain-containing protein [Solirubrobacterales bacterium]
MTTTTATLTADTELLFLGARCRILADSASTEGRYGLIDMIEVPAGDIPPLHVHDAHDEGFLLLEGELSLFFPGREVRLEPGEFVLAPRGVPHVYRVGDAPARFLVLSTPGGFEEFVRDVAALDEVSPEVLAATAAAREIQILAPPGTMP